MGIAKKLRRGRPGRPPVVENHPERDAILEALLTPGANMSAIQRKFKISEKSLDTFRQKFVTPATQEMLDRVAARPAIETMQLDALARLSNLAAVGEKMLRAADAWLEDPTAPGNYNLAPRSYEIEVVYEIDIGEGKTKKLKAPLSYLLSQFVAGSGHHVLSAEAKVTDPRKLLLEAVATLKPVVELIGKATGQLQTDSPIQIDKAVLVLAQREGMDADALRAETERIAGLLEGG